MQDGRVCCCPGVSAIVGAKHPRRVPSSDQPYIVALHRETCAASGKGTFASQRTWPISGGHGVPASSAIIGRNQTKLSIHWISHRDAMRGVKESHAIEKTFPILIGELERPGLASVNGLVD